MTSLINELLKQNLVTMEQINDAREKQLGARKPLHALLVEMGFISEDILIQVASKMFNMPVFDINREQIDSSATTYIPYADARRLGVFPIRKDGNTLVVGTTDPQDIVTLDDLRCKTQLNIRPVLIKKSQIDEISEKYYHSDDNLYSLLKNISEDTSIEIPDHLSSGAQIVNIEQLNGDTSTVVKLLNFILSDAIKERASDIHLEPQKDSLLIRYRIDGELIEVTKLSAAFFASLVARVKIISDLNIAEKRTPQDGRTTISVGGRIVDLRVSTIPIVHGEKVEIRILDPKEAKISFDSIGLEKEELAIFQEALRAPQGMILVTGPTGSGKTSTLYAALNFIKQNHKNIVTIEDPVEYMVEGINQMQVNPVKNVTFVNGLRSILRQDPDAILVGEIRDKETSEIAFRSSLTGHLVLSTLHTNNSVATITRLFDIGLEPYMISSSIILIIAQRLVKCICPYCKKEYTPVPDLMCKFETYITKMQIKKFFKGSGCDKCGFTGSYGRTAIFELLKMKDKIRELINARVTEDMVFNVAKREGLRSLAESGMRKVAMGLTTMEEVAKVAEVLEVEQALERPHMERETKKILIADDEEDILKVIEKNLTSVGYRVVKARDGKELVELAIKEKPDMIVSDVTMPKMNGFEAVRALRKRLDTAVIPVMLLTARDDMESELQGINAGADDYITKPFEYEKLIARVKMLLRRSSS
ncbi:MAG: ATPase, T2SS/T4P/T4SS family [Candidatus Omnitrophota bacterium]